MIRSLFVLILAFTAYSTQAIEVKELYQYRQPVEDKQRGTRATASKNALLNVVVKVTGDRNAQGNAVVRQALADVADYITKYEYSDEQGKTFLVVNFDSNKVEALVRDASLPLWGNRRPLVALWLAIEDGWQRELVSLESNPQIQELIDDRAQSRGLPVVTPLLDLEDLQRVSVADVWGNFSESLEFASERYMAERVVSARLLKDKNSQQWNLEWRFTNEDQFEPFKHQGDKQQVIANMLDAIANQLAREYAVDTSADSVAQQQVIKLYNTKNFVDIEYALRRLRTMSVVIDVTVSRISKERVEIQVTHSGTVDDLKKALTLDTFFVDYRDPQKYYYSNTNDSLEYAWQ
ncbi:DUF2066 domain-containing protein [Pseudoalteromonas sp. SSDWG2]|uniref:DUF2066 domain-containing protein n=1 Tax=Pseudoalteromonas sp. SSDWG2 TaxID=3139391 RepID=UPI003BAA3183